MGQFTKPGRQVQYHSSLYIAIHRFDALFICFVLAGWEERVHIVGKRLKTIPVMHFFHLVFQKQS
jgi:hypothetical protein